MIATYVIAGLVFLAIMLIVMGIAAPRAADEVDTRLLEYGGRQMTLEEIELSRPVSDRVLVPMIRASAHCRSVGQYHFLHISELIHDFFTLREGRSESSATVAGHHYLAGVIGHRFKAGPCPYPMGKGLQLQ